VNDTAAALHCNTLFVSLPKSRDNLKTTGSVAARALFFA
jgi:hypothetical protein